VHAPLFDPGELFTPGLLRRVDTAFRLPNDVGARGYYLSRLNHAACTLPVYASQRGSLRHHAPFVLIHVTVGFTMAAVFGIRLPRGGR